MGPDKGSEKDTPARPQDPFVATPEPWSPVLHPEVLEIAGATSRSVHCSRSSAGPGRSR